MNRAEPERRRFVVGVAIASVLFVVIAIVLRPAQPSALRTHEALASFVVCGGLTLIVYVYRVRRSVRRRRRAFFVLSFGALCGVVANLWTLAVELTGLPDTWAVFVNPVLLLALGFGIAGLLIFPPVRRRPTDLARLVMDGLVIGGSVLFVASVTIFPQLLAAGQARSIVRQTQLLILPLMDVLIATFATLLITRSGRTSRTPLILIGAGFWLYAFADLAYAVLSSATTHDLGSWWDLGWIAGYLVLGLAALHPTAGLSPNDEAQETSPVLSTVVLFVMFLAATGVSLVQGASGQLFLAARIVWALLILAVVGRQIVLVVDNERLRRTLEARVQTRTRELREITHRQELLLTSVADGIYGVDRYGMITFVNAATANLLLRDEKSLIGRHAHDLFHAPKEDGTPFPNSGCYVTEAIRSGLTVSGEEDTYVRGDGSTIAVEVSASPLSDDEAIRGAVVAFRDVSQRREMDRLKNEFVSVVSHELRTPLTSIRGALGLVAGGAFGPLSPQADRMITIATSGADRLGRLINDILDIERIESGTLPMAATPCDVSDVCQEAVTMVAGVADAAEVEIICTECSGTILADRDRVIQTLINLLGNAVKFSESGGRVTLSAAPREDVVEFAVVDKGRGIPPDKLEAVFGRFNQVDSSDARDKGGTGLGLAISRTIVERLGGRIWAESTLGEGATFRFTLPRGPGDAALNGEGNVQLGAESTVEQAAGQ